MIYVTVVGMEYRHGSSFIEANMLGNLKMKLVKEPDNKYDHEAIKVIVPGIGKVGYVANSYRTVGEECYSAGRLYDKIGDEAQCTVLYKLGNGSVICSVDDESLLENCVER